MRPSGAIAPRLTLIEVQIEVQKLDDKELVESGIVTDIVIPDTYFY
jgi:hypothetical protein